MTFDVVELERVRRDHRAERMSLAPLRIDPNFHGLIPLDSIVVPLEIAAGIDAQLHTGDVSGLI
jgi:hypothetical protein